MSREWDENNFEDRLANLEATWRSAEEAGRPISEARKTWGRVKLELEFSERPLSEVINIAVWCKAWKEEKNPHYIDLAYLACRKAQIEIPKTLLAIMDEVALERFRGVPRYGTGKKIEDQSALFEALRLMCGLHIAGASIPVAAQKVAQFIYDEAYGKPVKASTLERRYAEHYRTGNPSLEYDMRQGMSEEHLESWRELLARLPDADSDRIGNRRE